MIFHSRGNPIHEQLHISLNNVLIQQASTFTLLGFPLESSLSLNQLTNHVVSRLNICCLILQRARSFCGTKTLYLIFNAIGLSYIMYFSSLIYNCGNTNFNKLETKYKQCGSVIHNCFYSDLDSFDWPPLRFIIIKTQLTLLFKILNLGYAPPLKQLIISIFAPQTQYNLRNKNKMTIINKV